MSVIQQLLVAGKALDLTPNAFSFSSQSGVNPSTVATSNTITLTGFDAPVSWSVSGGTASVGGAGYTSSGTISPGQTVALRVTSSGSFSGSASATFTAGGVSGAFTVTTRAADTTPNAFSFTSQSGVNPTTIATSNTVTLTGFEAAVSWSVSGGTASVGGAGYTTSGTVSPGQTVSLRVTSSSSFNGSSSATFTAGGASGTFTVTTRAADTTPNAFSFTSQTNINLNTVVTSNTITLTGFEAAVSWSCSGGTASVGGGGYTTSGTISPGQTVTLRLTSGSTYGSSKTATFTAGGVSGTFTATNQAVDTAPAAFSIPSVSNAQPSTVITSSAFTPTGYNTATSWSISGTWGGTASVGGRAYATSGTISPGESVTIRLTSSPSFSTGYSTTFTAGGVSASFSVTTRAVDSTPDITGWTAVTNAARGATIYSGFSAVDSFDGTLSWTGTTTAVDAGCSVSGGPYTPSGTITAGQTMRLFCISSTTPGGTVTVTININGTTRTWSVKSV